MTQYGARHLLIKFSGSRNPVSRRTNCSTADVTAEAATAELQTYVDKINAEGATEEVRQPASQCRPRLLCMHIHSDAHRAKRRAPRGPLKSPVADVGAIVGTRSPPAPPHPSSAPLRAAPPRPSP